MSDTLYLGPIELDVLDSLIKSELPMTDRELIDDTGAPGAGNSARDLGRKKLLQKLRVKVVVERVHKGRPACFTGTHPKPVRALCDAVRDVPRSAEGIAQVVGWSLGHTRNVLCRARRRELVWHREVVAWTITDEGRAQYKRAIDAGRVPGVPQRRHVLAFEPAQPRRRVLEPEQPETQPDAPAPEGELVMFVLAPGLRVAQRPEEDRCHHGLVQGQCSLCEQRGGPHVA